MVLFTGSKSQGNLQVHMRLRQTGYKTDQNRLWHDLCSCIELICWRSLYPSKKRRKTSLYTQKPQYTRNKKYILKNEKNFSRKHLQQNEAISLKNKMGQPHCPYIQGSPFLWIIHSATSKCKSMTSTTFFCSWYRSASLNFKEL